MGEGATPEAQGDSLGPVAGEGTGAPGALFCGLGELDDVRILGTEFEERLEARPIERPPWIPGWRGGGSAWDASSP